MTIDRTQIERALRFARPVLQANYDAGTASDLLAKMQANYLALAPSIPQLGLPFNRMVLKMAVDSLAFYRALPPQLPKPTAFVQVQAFVNNWMDGQFDRWIARKVYANRVLHRIYRRYWFDQTNRADELDGQRFEYIPPQGKLYYGVNVIRCGIVRYLGREGAPEIAPLMCKGDEHIRKYLPRGVDFARTQLIAEGADYCDFRYKLTKSSP